MSLYPLFLDLSGHTCLVAGLGSVGRRKAASLIAAAPALIRLVDPGIPHPEEKQLFSQAKAAGVKLQREQRSFVLEDLNGCALVFAATSDPDINAHIAMVCKEQRILCNVADAPDAGNFLVPAAWQQANIQVAVSTAGASPSLAAHIRDELSIFLDGRYTLLAQLLDHLRPLFIEHGKGADWNKQLFRKLMDAGLPTSLQVRDHVRAAAILRSLLPPEVHAGIIPFLNTLAARPGRIIQ